MGLFSPDPPQGFSEEQGLFIIGRPHIPRIDSPQGIDKAVVIPTGANMLYETLGVMQYETTGSMEYET